MGVAGGSGVEEAERQPVEKGRKEPEPLQKPK